MDEPDEEIPIGEKMLLLVTTTDTNLTIKLPLTGTVNCTIDWGDDTSETVTDSYPTHTYIKTGSFLVMISGTVTALHSGDLNESERTGLTGVSNWGNTGLTTMYQAFKGCTQLSYLSTMNESGFPESITSFYETFTDCSSLTEIPSGLFDNCTQVTAFTNTFAGCSGLTVIPVGLFDHCTEVTSFNSTFMGCSALTEIPTGLFNNCLYVKDFIATFQNCENIGEIPSGLFDHCTRIHNLLLTFAGCTSLQGESPYSVLDGKKVHLYERMEHTANFTVPDAYAFCFSGCTGLSDFNDIPDEWK